MGVEMTIEAIRKLAVHGTAMGQSMTGTALRHYLMLTFVAVGTQQGTMLSGGVGQILTDIAMAAAA